MFERFTESARRALFFARYQASELGSVVIDTEHMLLGIMRDMKGLAAAVLMGADCSPGILRKEIEGQSVFREKVPTSTEIPFSDDVKRALQYAMQEADRLGHDYIGTEHLLLGLLREDNPIGMVLASHGVRLAEAREIVRKTDAPPAASGGISSDDDLLQVDQIKALVRQLAHLPSGGNDARALTDRILRALDALKPPPRE